MKKRLIAAVFAALAAFCRADGVAVGDTWTTNNLVYKVSQKADESLYLTLTGWVSATNEVVVPATVTRDDETLNVLEIGKDAFKSKTTIMNLVLSEGLEYIGTNAFYGCSNLLGVNLPDSVTVVAKEAFYRCTAMTNVSFGSGLLAVEDTAFYYCNSLGEVVLPDSLTSLGNGAFYGCDAVTNFVVGSGLARVEFGSSVGRFPQSAPMHFTVNGNGETVIGGSCFNSAKIRRLTLRGVKSIEDGSSGTFNRCNQLASVDFGDDLVHLGKRAFSECKALSSVSFPDSLRTVGEYAFFNCTNLSEIAFGSGVESIGGSAFYYCDALRDIEIPANVTNIAEYAFNGCSGLTNFVRNVGGGRVTAWFPSNLDNLKTIRIVGNGEATIAPGAFRTSSTSYKVKARTVELVGVKAIESSSGSNGAFANANIGTVTMDGSMLDIGDYSFYSSRLGAIVIPDSVTNIGRYAFGYCGSLSNLVIGASVKTIGDSAFSSCSSISEVVIPNSVTNVGQGAFGCNSLTNLVIGSGLERIKPNQFNTSELVSLTVNGSGETIIEDSFCNGSKVRNVTLRGVKQIGTGSSGAFWGCNKLVSVDLGEGLVQLGKNSFYNCNALPSIALPDSLRIIGESSFSSCTNLQHIAFGSGVTDIGVNAFYWCSGIRDIEIPVNVTNVGGSAFCGLTSITNFTIRNAGGRITSNWIARGGASAVIHIIGDGETTIAPSTFVSTSWSDSSKMLAATVTLAGVKAIEDASGYSYGAFSAAPVASVEMDSSMRHIGNYAFYGSKLETVNVPGSVTNIGESAFYSCQKLRRVRLGEGLETIGRQAFSTCKSLAYIEIPTTVTNISGSAFSSCLHSLVVFFKGPPPQGVASIGLSKGSIVIRPKAYAAEWEGVTIPNAKIVPEPEEGVTWTRNADRDWSSVDGVVEHSGMVAEDETWAADKIHVVSGWVTVTNGVAVTVERGALVKFCPGMGVYVMPDAQFDVSGATLTHIRDDAVGGDTDGDSGLNKPIAGDYLILGYIDEDGWTNWRNRIFYLEGSIESDEVWSGGGNVYYALGTVTIGPKATVTVDAGAIVKFDEFQNLVARGSLSVAGTRQEPVYFTSYRDDEVGGDTDGDGGVNNPHGGDWTYIIVSGNATFDHAVLRYGSQRSSSANGILVVDVNGDVRLSNCTVSDSFRSLVQINRGGKRLVAENCVFSGAEFGAAKLSGGTASFRNCLFTGCQSIAEIVDTSPVFTEQPNFHNCVFLSLDRWLSGYGRTLVESDDRLLFSHCCFWNRRDGSDVCELVGTNGNILANPLFADVEKGDWRIASGSPCIDAGDAFAPERDAYGQPRQNVKATPTGVKNAKGRYADIGLYEVIPVAGAADAPDLETFDVTVPSEMTVGDEVTVSYKVCNVSDANDELGTVRYDRVELVGANGTVVEVFRAARPAARIACRRGTVLSETATFTVPALALGNVRVRVTANCERDIFEGVMYENNTAQSGAIRLDAPEVAFDSLAGHALTLPANGSYACRLSGEQAAERLLVLRGGADNSISARTGVGAMPTAGAFATQATALGGNEYILVLPAGEDVSLVIDNDGSALANVAVVDLGPGFVLYDSGATTTAVNTNFLYKATKKLEKGIWKQYREIASGSSANPYGMPKGLYLPAESGGKTTYVGVDTNAIRVLNLRIWGNGFTDGTTAALVNGGSRIEARSMQVYSSNSAYAEFEYYGCEPGEYALEVSDGGTTRSTGTKLALWEPIDYYLNGGQDLRLLPGDPDSVEVSVSKFPQRLRGGRIYTGAVSWRNATDKELDAPYLRLVADNVRIRLNESCQWSSKIDFIVLSATQPFDKIKPGEMRTMSFQFVTPDENGYIEIPLSLNTASQGTQENASPSDWQTGRRSSGRSTSLRYAVRLQTLPGDPTGAVAADGTEPYPWDNNEPYFRPADMNDELWTLVWSQIRGLYGETWGSYVARLRSRAAAFAAAYRKPPMVIEKGDILSADVSRTMSDKRVCRQLETACDLKRPGRGASFKIERTYGAALASRMADGMFGRGWTTMFDVRLVKNGNSRATVAQPGWPGSRYEKLEGDAIWRQVGGFGHSTLVGNVETAADGSYRVFADDGLLTRSCDRYGNGFEIARDGSRRITKIQHSDGAYFTFEYDGSSPVPSRIVDDVGNVAAYAYTMSDGVYMLASAETSRGTAEYAYREADATAASRALVRMEGGSPDAVTRSFGWDSRGRLTSITEYDRFTTEFIFETDDRIRTVTAAGQELVSEYTPWGCKASVTRPDGSVIRCEYEEGAVAPVAYVLPSGKRIDLKYDVAGNLIQVTSNTGKESKITYNEESQVAQISSPYGTRTYSFDENGENSGVKSITGRSMSFGWNGETGDLAEESYPDGVHGWRYEYGQYGLLSSVVSKDSKLRYRYECDAAGRVVRAAVVRKSEASAAPVSLMSSPRLLGAPVLRGSPPDEEEIYVETLVYDSKGRLQSFTSNGHTVEFGYDTNGRLTSIIDEDGEGERYTYDSLGRLSQVIDATDASIVHVAYAYDDANGGRLVKETFGNGMVTTYGYNADGKVDLVATKFGDDWIARYWYDYNADGKISACGDSVAGERNDFLYDGDGQIVDVVYMDADGKKRDASTEEEAKKTYDDVLGYLTKLEKGDAEWEYMYDEFNYVAEIKNGDESMTITYERDAYGKIVGITVNGKKTEKVTIPSKDFTINIYEEDGTKKHVINSPMGAVGVSVSGGSSGSGKQRHFNVKDKNGATKQTVDENGKTTSYKNFNLRQDATDNSTTTTPAQTYYGEPDEQVEESGSSQQTSTQQQDQSKEDVGTSTSKQTENPDTDSVTVTDDACYVQEQAKEKNYSEFDREEWNQQQQQQQQQEQGNAEADAQAQKAKDEEEERLRAEEARKKDQNLKDAIAENQFGLGPAGELFEYLQDEAESAMATNPDVKQRKKKEAQQHLENAKDKAKDQIISLFLPDEYNDAKGWVDTFGKWWDCYGWW